SSPGSRFRWMAARWRQGPTWSRNTAGGKLLPAKSAGKSRASPRCFRRLRFGARSGAWIREGSEHILDEPKETQSAGFDWRTIDWRVWLARVLVVGLVLWVVAGSVRTAIQVFASPGLYAYVPLGSGRG